MKLCYIVEMFKIAKLQVRKTLIGAFSIMLLALSANEQKSNYTILKEQMLKFMM